MKEYYIIINDKVKGPLKIDQLKKYKIDKDTPAHYVGMPEWSTVKYISELNNLLCADQPSTFAQEEKIQIIPNILFFFIFFGFIFLCYVLFMIDNAKEETYKSSINLFNFLLVQIKG